MPDQVVPITGLADVGVIKDTPAVSLPPNAFTDARNVRFRDGAVRKMEGEVDIFAGMSDLFDRDINPNIGRLQYLAWWPSPNRTTRDEGYYIFVVEKNIGTADAVNFNHAIYAMLPGATYNDTSTWNEIGQPNGYNSRGKWQHTLFNGGFTFIINNGRDKPLYITDPQGNTDINMLSLADLPGWDSYQVNETILQDTFTETSSVIFDTGQIRETGVTDYIITRTRAGTIAELFEGSSTGGISNAWSVATMNNQDAITFAPGILQAGDEVQVNFQSVDPVIVRAAIVRAFGDFLVAGNLVEFSIDNTNPNDPREQIVRRLTGVVRTSDVAQPGSIPNGWNPFAVGASTADEFVIADTGTVQDMVPLQGNMYLYTNSSISVLRLTGNPAVPLTVQPVTDQYGALTTDAVLEYDGRHFVIGSDDIYLFGGHPGSIQSISDQKIRRDFFDRVNPINDNLINLFTLRHAAKDEIWVCYPTVDSVSGEADEAYIWNYRNNTWTIRTLISVVSGDIAPVPGGGVPSAIITLDGLSGTDDVIRVGSREVQTIDVSGLATVGHASSSRPELYELSALTTNADGVTRPALELDAPELVEVTIGDDFYAGPNPAMQEYNIINIPNVQVGAFASGGVRFRIEYTLASANTGNTETMITVHANELSLPGTGTRTITGEQYAAVLAPHLDSLTEFQDWTITANGNTINLLSDFAGMRELRALEIVTFTSTVNEITDVGPFTGTDAESRVFRDSLGDELFTVTRSGEAGDYSFSVFTQRDTGFDDSDGITQLAFETDGETFVAPDPFNSASGTFTFASASGSYAIRTQPPANFVNLIRQPDRIPDTGVIDAATTTEDLVTITRAEVEGGFLQTGDGNSTTEGVTVNVRNTTSMASTNTAVVGNSSSVVDSGGTYNYATADTFIGISTSSAGAPNFVRSYRTSDRTQVSAGCDVSSNSCHQSQAVPGWPIRPSDDILNSWTHSAAAGEAVTSIITTWDLGSDFTRPDGVTVRRQYSGFGVEYANGVRLFFATGDTFNFFYGWSNQGANRGAGGIISSHAGNIRVIYGGNESVTVNSRAFDVTNNNPYPITFRAQGQSAGTSLTASSSLTTIAGTVGSTDETWSWSSGAISFNGTSIGGSTTADLRGANGRRETTMNGVTVVSQNTSSPQTTTSGTARDQAVLLPANNGGSVSNPTTATWNPTGDFIGVNWRGDNRSSVLGAYRLSDGTRVAGGRNFGRGSSNNPPAGWDNGFESGGFPQTPLFSASNITDPVALGAVSQAVSRGVINSNSQGSSCDNLQSATATSNFGSNGIRQRGTSTSEGPAVGIQGRRGRAGFGWTVPSTGRSNECGGNLNNGVSFSGDFRVYTPAGGGDRATGVRIVLFGPNVTTTVTVPRASSETYTVINNNPFTVELSVAGQTLVVPADSSRTLTVSSEGNSWTLASAAPTTNYQYTVTNNNIRPLVSGSLVHDGVTTDLTGLGSGESIFGGLSTERTAVVNFVREIEQSGAMTVTTMADLELVRSGIGTIPTDPDDLEAIRYNFNVDFTDNTSDISIDYQPAENRDPNNADNLDNLGAVAGFVAALNAAPEFTMYFRTITNREDSEIPTNSFRIEALAAPGNEISPGLLMPPHNAISINTPINMQNGGNPDITVTTVQRATVSEQGHEPITVMLESGPRIPMPDGTFMPVVTDQHAVTINGMFPATEDGRRELNEVLRDSLRLAPSFQSVWTIGTTTPNPDNIPLTSNNNGPHFLRVASVTPTTTGLLPTHFSTVSTQQGTITPEDPTYPTIILEGPVGEGLGEQMIMLDPEQIGDNSTDRLTSTDITNIIRNEFSATGWAVLSNDDPNIGTAPSANQIRIARNQEGVVNSGTDQTMGWRVTGISYGNTGNTLPGTARDPIADGTEIGRLNVSDFARANINGRVGPTGVAGNELVTAVGTGNRLDFRGSRTERSQPTRVMISITNPDVTSMDPVPGPDGTFLRNEDGSLALMPGNTQYIPLSFGGPGNYDGSDQTGSQPGTRINATDMVRSVESAINNANRRLQTDLQGTTLSIIPSQFSELANFVLDLFLNDNAENVERWNAIVVANRDTQERLVPHLINVDDNGGVQSTVPANRW